MSYCQAQEKYFLLECPENKCALSEMKMCEAKAVTALGLTCMFRKLSVGRTEKERKKKRTLKKKHPKARFFKKVSWRGGKVFLWGLYTHLLGSFSFLFRNFARLQSMEKPILPEGNDFSWI